MFIAGIVERLENGLGVKPTTAFELERDTSGWKLKTVCPFCGIKLGDKKEGN